MPVSARTLAMLMDAGLDGDRLLAVVSSIDGDAAMMIATVEESTDDRRRARDRERKRLERLRADEDQASLDIPRTIRGQSADDPSPKEIPPTPPKEITPTRPSLRSGEISARAAFDDFWSVVPRKTGKDAAAKAFIAIVRKGRATAEQIIAGAIRWRDESRNADPQFVPHPSTWLNRGGWEDEPQQARAGPGQRPQSAAARAAMMHTDEPESPDDPRDFPRNGSAESPRAADPPRSGFAGPLSEQDAEAARRDALVYL